MNRYYEVTLPDGTEYIVAAIYRGGLPDGTKVTEVRPGGRRFNVPVYDGYAQLWAIEEISDD